MVKLWVNDIYLSTISNVIINSKLSMALESDIASVVESLDQIGGHLVKYPNDAFKHFNKYLEGINSLDPSGFT